MGFNVNKKTTRRGNYESGSDYVLEYGENVLEVAAAKDQESVEAFAADAADPALGVRPGLRCAHRRLDHAEAVRAEDLVELADRSRIRITAWTGGRRRSLARSAASCRR